MRIYPRHKITVARAILMKVATSTLTVQGHRLLTSLSFEFSTIWTRLSSIADDICPLRPEVPPLSARFISGVATILMIDTRVI